MADGYSRQSSATIAPGEDIDAGPLNNEFNAIEAAFDEVTGHNHDGTAQGGAPLPPTALSGVSGNGVIVRTSSSAFANRTITAGTGISVSNGDGVGGNPTINIDSGGISETEIANNSVTDSKLRDSTGLSVIGRSANTTGDPADIVASADHGVLRRNGTSVGFGTVATDGIANSAVTYAKIQNVSTTNRLLGRSSAGAGDVEEIVCTAAGRNLIDDADAAAQRTTLGVAIGTDVQAYSARLQDIAGLTATNNNFIIGNGTTWVSATPATARTSLGLGSLATLSTINNSNWSGTALAVANGGTGATSAANARVALGVAIGTDVQAYSAALGQIASLGDPNVDRIVFWDDSAGTYAYLAPGTGLAITGTTLDVSISSATTSAEGVVELATAAEIRSGTASRAIPPDEAQSAMGWVALSDATTVSVVHTAGVNRTLSSTANRTIGNPSSAIPGLPLNILLTHSGAARSWTFQSNYKFGAAGSPDFSGASAGWRDLVTFLCLDSTNFLFLGMQRNV